MKQHLPSLADNIIPIVASSDDNYAEPLTVMLISLLENTQNPERFHLFVIDGGISQQKQDIMIKSIEERNSQLTFLAVNSELYANFPTKSHVSAPAYYRISIPELFDEHVNKVIYLDCDLIIKDDLQMLWQVDLENHAIAAVENISNRTYKQSGLAQPDYFNSGVMLINLAYWRDHNIAQKVRSFKINHPERISTNDQCALNGVFEGQWLRLALRWNHQSGLYRNSSQTKRLQQSDEFEDALWNPGIIHFVGWSKPWIIPCYHPLEGEYTRYKAMSSYRKTDESSANNRSTAVTSFITRLKKRWRKGQWQKRYQLKGYSLYKS